jgi:hypothetical protein
VHVLADGDLRHVADDGDRLAASAHCDPQHAEAALGVVVRDAIDLPGEVLRAPLIARERKGTASSSFTSAGTHARKALPQQSAN